MFCNGDMVSWACVETRMRSRRVGRKGGRERGEGKKERERGWEGGEGGRERTVFILEVWWAGNEAEPLEWVMDDRRRGLLCPCACSIRIGLAWEVPICKPQGRG